MSKVIVPKNYVYADTITVSGINTSNIIGSTYTTNYQVLPEDNDILGFNLTVDYKLSNSTVDVQWTSATIKNITIKNSDPFDCNFIILTVTGLPKIKNTGSVSGPFRLRLVLSDNTYINLLSHSIAIDSTLTIPNQTYYVDLVNKTATTNANNLAYNYNKAVIYSDSYWYTPKEIYTDNNIVSSYTITPKNPHPYIFNNIELRGCNYSASEAEYTTISVSLPTNIIINIDTSNNPSYVYLLLTGMPKYKNTGSFVISLNIYIRIAGVDILIQSDNIRSGDTIEAGASGTIYIDVVNKKLIGIGNLNPNFKKTITHL